MNRKKLIKSLIVVIFFISVVNFLANKLFWYSGIWWFDMLMHFLGGFWLSLFYFYLSPVVNFTPKTILKVLLFVFLVGIGWEIFEVLVNKVTIDDSFNYLDTFSDICFDLAGGGSAIIYVLRRIVVTSTNDVQLG